MPLQAMTDNCDFQHESQFAQDDCHHIIETEKCNVFTTKLVTALDDSTNSNASQPPPPPLCDATESATMNGNVHLGLCDTTLDETTLVTESHSPSSVEEKEACDDDDDFCDFEGYADVAAASQAVTAAAEAEATITTTNDNHAAEFAAFAPSTVQGENFANFEHHSNWSTPAVESHENVDDEEFADFKCASQDNNKPSGATQPAPKINTDWAQLFRSTFPEPVQLDATSLQSPEGDCLDTSNAPTGQIFQQSSAGSQALWSNLQEMDLKSICLLNKWKNSSSFKRLLQALKVDGSIIQLNSDIFPSSYSSNFGQILEPISVNTWEHSAQESHSSDSAVKMKTVESTVAVPDGEFQSSILSLNQDLDFFESKYTAYKSSPNAKADDLISEFETIILDGDSSQQPPHEEPIKQMVSSLSSSASPISSVNDLRKMLQSTIAKTNNEQVLSAEALQILNELPSLSFVRANVLMFPVNEQNG